MGISVTEKAQERFRRALLSEDLEDHAIRVLAERTQGGRIIYGLDFSPPTERGADDQELLYEDLRVWIEPEVGALIEGTVIDYVERPNGSCGFKFNNPKAELGWENPVAAKLQGLIDQQINPAIAAHGGAIELLQVKEDTAVLRMLGGCQGCGMAAVTLREGVERQVLEAIPEIRRIEDVTDHGAGENPYY